MTVKNTETADPGTSHATGKCATTRLL